MTPRSVQSNLFHGSSVFCRSIETASKKCLLSARHKRSHSSLQNFLRFEFSIPFPQLMHLDCTIQ